MEELVQFVGHPIFKQTLYPQSHPLHDENSKSCWTKPHSGRCFYCAKKYKDQIAYSRPLWWNETKDEYIVFGLYCTPNCIKAHISESPMMGACSEQLHMFTHMMIRVYKVFDNITAAPEKYLFNHFPNGPIDHATWKQTKAIHPKVHLRFVPFVWHQAVVEQSLPFYQDYMSAHPSGSSSSSSFSSSSSLSLLRHDDEKKECVTHTTLDGEIDKKIVDRVTKKRGRPRKKPVMDSKSHNETTNGSASSKKRRTTKLQHVEENNERFNNNSIPPSTT